MMSWMFTGAGTGLKAASMLLKVHEYEDDHYGACHHAYHYGGEDSVKRVVEDAWGLVVESKPFHGNHEQDYSSEPR